MTQLLIIAAALLLLHARNLRRWNSAWPVIVLIIIILGAAGQMDLRDAERERDEYCTMVRVHDRDPRYGWPDYKGIFADECMGRGNLDSGNVH